MKNRFQSIILGLAVVITAMLTACHNKLPPVPTTPHPLTSYQLSLVSQIRKLGAQVIKQGEVLQIILPTDTFFQANTVHLKSQKQYAIGQVAALVKSYTTPYAQPQITITGYTDQVFARKTRRQLSMQYAQEVTAYLWHHGVSSRRLRVRGVGAALPIANNQTVRGSAYNRRVVIKIN